jgi:flavodoxin
MKAVVIYDSRSGYTAAIAHEVGEVLRRTMDVEVLHVTAADASELSGVHLLVVGGPTEGHGATLPMREWLAGLGTDTLAGIPAAAFDTRINWPKLLSGSAAGEISRSLRHAGVHELVAPESFIVSGRVNPMPGPAELEHVTAWATTLAESLAVPAG